MLSRIRFTTLQSGLVLFWAIWFSFVTLTNIFDALKHLNLLPQGFTFASYNFALVEGTLAAHGLPVVIAALLFAVVILWELLACGLFWRAWVAMRNGASGRSGKVTQAFFVSLALWAAFLIATEATVNYLTAETHKGNLIAQLATLIVVRARAGGTSDSGREG